MKRLTIHAGRRYLMWEDGTPFFYLGDTAWDMFLRLTRAEIEHYLSVRAAPELVADDPAKMAHQGAARGERYAFLYSPLSMPIHANLAPLGGKAIKAAWFDPRTGESEAFAIVPPAQALFVPPSCGKGCDWVLVLDVLD